MRRIVDAVGARPGLFWVDAAVGRHRPAHA
jgi:hypothetical protein